MAKKRELLTIARAETLSEAKEKARKYIKPRYRIIKKTKTGYNVCVKI